jgi:hypothetical protein
MNNTTDGGPETQSLYRALDQRCATCFPASYLVFSELRYVASASDGKPDLETVGWEGIVEKALSKHWAKLTVKKYVSALKREVEKSVWAEKGTLRSGDSMRKIVVLFVSFVGLTVAVAMREREKLGSLQQQAERAVILERDVEAMHAIMEELNASVVNSSESYWGFTTMFSHVLSTMDRSRAKLFAKTFAAKFAPEKIMALLPNRETFTSVVEYLGTRKPTLQGFRAKAKKFVNELELGREKQQEQVVQTTSETA